MGQRGSSDSSTAMASFVVSHVCGLNYTTPLPYYLLIRKKKKEKKEKEKGIEGK